MCIRDRAVAGRSWGRVAPVVADPSAFRCACLASVSYTHLYDSFVHNAVQLLRESSEPVNITIQLNDRIDFEKFGDYDGVLLSDVYKRQEWKFRCRMDAGEGPSLLTLDTPMHANGRL